jgi:2-polyprenyl-3-methyl-5-hydroxy-6-metoxy-1,4-benzoquinol methylase
LSIGCGSAETESKLVEKGIECVCIPLDSVIGAVAEIKGVRTFYPDFDKALNCIAGEKFDCILMLNILQYVDDPLDLIRKCKYMMSPQGVLLGTVPNEDCIEKFLPKRYKTGMGSDRVRSYRLRDIVQSGLKIIGSKISRHIIRRSKLYLITKRELKLWLYLNGMKITKINYVNDNLSQKRRRIAIGPLKSFFADKLIFEGKIDN